MEEVQYFVDSTQYYEARHLVGMVGRATILEPASFDKQCHSPPGYAIFRPPKSLPSVPVSIPASQKHLKHSPAHAGQGLVVLPKLISYSFRCSGRLKCHVLLYAIRDL